MNRREALTALLCSLGVLASGEALAGPRGRARRKVKRKTRRRVRRRVRRRIRRRVVWRTVGKRRALVVPVAMAVGWELAYDNRVVVVHEVKHVTVEGTKTEVVVIKNEDGTTEELAVVREDTADNGAEQQGSTLADGDTTTPAIETEEEVEVEE